MSVTELWDGRATEVMSCSRQLSDVYQSLMPKRTSTYVQGVRGRGTLNFRLNSTRRFNDNGVHPEMDIPLAQEEFWAHVCPPTLGTERTVSTFVQPVFLVRASLVFVGIRYRLQTLGIHDKRSQSANIAFAMLVGCALLRAGAESSLLTTGTDRLNVTRRLAATGSRRHQSVFLGSREHVWASGYPVLYLPLLSRDAAVCYGLRRNPRHGCLGFSMSQ